MEYAPEVFRIEALGLYVERSEVVAGAVPMVNTRVASPVNDSRRQPACHTRPQPSGAGRRAASATPNRRTGSRIRGR